MLNKIDKVLLTGINALTNLKKDCIVRLDNKTNISSFVKDNNINDYEYFSSINSLSCKLTTTDMYRLAGYDVVVHISSIAKVCTMVNIAKKIIGVGCDIAYGDFSTVIIDTGLYPHLDFMLGKRCKIIKFIDFVNDKNYIYDDNGHGTFITSLLAGNGVLSGNKYSGIDKCSNIIVIKALDNNGETTALNILKSMQWVYDNIDKYNIKIVCMSFGSNVLEKNDPLIQGAEALWDRGVVVVSACGNSGPKEATIKSPSASPKVISVGALDDNRIGDEFNISSFKVAEFSSRGPILSNYKPDVIVSGVDVISSCNFPITKKFYERMSGTSVSTPIVAGVVSKLIKKYPNHTPDQIKRILINNCRIINGDRNSEGYGWLDLHNIF